MPKFKLFKEAEGRVRSLSPQDFDRLCRELPEHLADMAVFSVATGLRQANVKGLAWQYVDLERRYAWIPGSKHNNGKPHSVPLNEMALSVQELATETLWGRMMATMFRKKRRGTGWHYPLRIKQGAPT